MTKMPAEDGLLRCRTADDATADAVGTVIDPWTWKAVDGSAWYLNAA